MTLDLTARTSRIDEKRCAESGQSNSALPQPHDPSNFSAGSPLSTITSHDNPLAFTIPSQIIDTSTQRLGRQLERLIRSGDIPHPDVSGDIS